MVINLNLIVKYTQVFYFEDFYACLPMAIIYNHEVYIPILCSEKISYSDRFIGFVQPYIKGTDCSLQQ